MMNPEFACRYPTFSQRIEEALAGPNTTAARLAQSRVVMQRTVFTVSACCPGELSAHYAAVACTNKLVYIVSLDDGHEESALECRAPVFAMCVGPQRTLLFGDIFGNLYVNTMR